MTDSIEKIKEDFERWCGFPLEHDNREGIMNAIKQRQWDLECEIHHQAKILEKRIQELLPED